MRVFVAGATGAIGRQLVPRLVAAGHEVHGMTRSGSKRALLRELGATPVVADALDAEQVAAAVATARPDVVVHQLTAIGSVDTRHIERDFAATNRLRIEGTDHLLSAAQAAGAKRFVAQGNVALYARSGGVVKTEDADPDPDPVPEMRPNVEAMLPPRASVLGARWTEGIVLRYGWFYGPGTGIARTGRCALVRKRGSRSSAKAAPLVVHPRRRRRGRGGGDQRGHRGVYNIVDDDPAPVAEWLPGLAKAAAAKQPRSPAVRRPGGAGQAGDRHDDRAARRVQRQGQARARLEPERTRAGGRASPRPDRRSARIGASSRGAGAGGIDSRSGAQIRRIATTTCAVQAAVRAQFARTSRRTAWTPACAASRLCIGAKSTPVARKMAMARPALSTRAPRGLWRAQPVRGRRSPASTARPAARSAAGVRPHSAATPGRPTSANSG